MNKNITIAVTLGLLLSPLTYIHANESDLIAQVEVTESVRIKAQGVNELRQDVNAKKQIILKTAQDARMDMKEDVRGASTTRNAAMKAIGLRVKEDIKVNQESFKASLELRKKALKTEIETRKDAQKVKLSSEAKARVDARLKNIFTRLSHQTDKLSTIDTRIADRINVLNDAGADVADVEVQFEIAQKALSQAKTDVLATQAVSTSTTATTTSKEALRELVKIATTSIKTSGKAYKEVLSLLREAAVGIEIEVQATTTVEATQD